MKRIVSALGVLLVLAAVVFAVETVEAGGGGGGYYACDNDKKASQAPDSTALEVTVRDACFGPVIARVAPGTELRWTNRGQMPHNIVDVNAPAKGDKMLQPGASVTMTFAQAGAFVYYCSMHPGMVGTVFVGDSLVDANPEVTSSAVSARTPPQNPLAPRMASAQLSENDGEGMATQTVILLALVVGTIAGAGSTLITRRLDSR